MTDNKNGDLFGKMVYPNVKINGKVEVLWNCMPLRVDKRRTIPRFSKNQMVCFVGGAGKILYCRPESGTWTYAVEMELNPEPDISRVGSETTLLLHEAEIHSVMN